MTAIDPQYFGALTAFLSAQPAVEVVDPADADVCVVGPDHLERVGGRGAPLVIGPDDPMAMIAAVENGAVGYLTEHSSLDEVFRAVRSVADGEAVVPPLMLGSLLRHVVQRRRAERADLELLGSLTGREREVFDLVAAGLDRAAISERLFVSVGTVRSHLQRVFRKLDVHSQAEAVALAARCGLATSDPERGS